MVAMKVDPLVVEETAKELYIRALKILPPDVKRGLDRLAADETADRARRAGDDDSQHPRRGSHRQSALSGYRHSDLQRRDREQRRDRRIALKAAIRRGCARATREHPLRSSVVHPVTRTNEHTSCGVDAGDQRRFPPAPESSTIEMIPKGSGSENNSFLKMAIPAEGIDAIKTFVIDCVLEAGGKTCPPTIVGVGVGGTSDLCVHLAKVAATRPLGTRCDDPEGAKLEARARRSGQRARRRAAGAGRRLDRVRRACRDSRRRTSR